MDAEQYKEEILPLRTDLLRYAGKIVSCREDAEDIVQEVFLKLWATRTELAKYRNIRALSVEMTKNLCLNKLNEAQAKTVSLENSIVPEKNLSTPHHKLEEKDRLDAALDIIEELPELQRLILKMKHIEGYEVREIAEITGGTEESVRMNLSRARKKVRELFIKLES